MSGTLRPFALVAGGDAWMRASHQDTFLELDRGIVELAWQGADEERPPVPPADAACGLAYDAECRVYLSDARAGTVTRTLWGAGDAAAVDLFDPGDAAAAAAGATGGAGAFTPVQAAAGPLRAPRGLAVDVDDRLFLAESGAGRILVYDLWSRRLLRSVPTGAATRPLDVAAHGRTVLAAVAGVPGLLRLTAREGPVPYDVPPEVMAPQRVAISPAGNVAVLLAAGTDSALLVPLERPHDAIFVERATDLEWQADDVLVVARFPGETFRRFQLTPSGVETILPLVARGYDGRGIARAPDGRIAYATAAGVRFAAVARVHYTGCGEVTTFRLDSGEYQTTWGRIFLDACLPAGTSLRLYSLTSDDAFDEPTLPRVPPGNLLTVTVARPDLSPPMPPLSLLPRQPGWRPLHRRESGPEPAWLQMAQDDPFITYETPVLAPPGRYLWVTLELRGTRHLSPRIRALRAEHPGHDLLRRLPRTFSREEPDADFLRRFLAMAGGLMEEMETRAAYREILLNPAGTPEDMLPWLASFLGMTLDPRWSEAQRRTLVAEAAWLFRFRGTIPGLQRFLEIYLGPNVIILEEFRLRGIGGGIVGQRGPLQSRGILGAGFRVGGAIAGDAAGSASGAAQATAGTAGGGAATPLSGSVRDAFALHAHRFTVLLRSALTQEQLDVVNDILAVHRPAHTLVEVCPLGSGMRVGRGLHLGLSSVIGRTGGFSTLQLGASLLGRGAVVGRPEAGTIPGSGRLGQDTRVG